VHASITRSALSPLRDVGCKPSMPVKDGSGLSNCAPSSTRSCDLFYCPSCTTVSKSSLTLEYGINRLGGDPSDSESRGPSIRNINCVSQADRQLRNSPNIIATAPENHPNTSGGSSKKCSEYRPERNAQTNADNARNISHTPRSLQATLQRERSGIFGQRGKRIVKLPFGEAWPRLACVAKKRRKRRSCHPMTDGDQLATTIALALQDASFRG